MGKEIPLILLFFKIVLPFLVSLPFHIDIRVILSMSKKNLDRNYNKLALSILRRIDVAPMFSLPTYEQNISIYLIFCSPPPTLGSTAAYGILVP